MNFTTVALSNLKRNPVRSILTGLSLAVSAATLTIVLSLDRGYASAVTEELVNKTGVHLYVTKEGCPIEAASVIAQGGLSPLFVEESLVEKIKQVPGISVVMPFKLFAITLEDGSRTDIYMGVDSMVSKVKPDWKYAKGGWFSTDTSVILGAEMARIENLNIGDEMYVENFKKVFVVSGILERNYGQDDGTIFLPLKEAQKLVEREGKLSAIAVKVNDISQLNSIRNHLRASLPADYYVIGSKELSEGILEFFKSTRVIMFVMVIVALLISVFGIINTMLMAVLERRREIAYLKCVGAGRSDLLKLITLEALVICIAGSLFGTLVGALISPVFGNFLRQIVIAYVPTSSIAQPNLQILLTAFFLCTLVGIICSLYPGYKAAKVVPMEVLRND